MISIDIDALKDEKDDLQAFLNEKLGVQVNADSKSLSVGSEENKLSRGKVKDYTERFFYRRGLSEKYKVKIEKDAIKIVKRKT